MKEHFFLKGHDPQIIFCGPKKCVHPVKRQVSTLNHISKTMFTDTAPHFFFFFSNISGDTRGASLLFISFFRKQ